MALTRLGNRAAHSPELIWAHGWAGSGSDLVGFAEALERDYPSVVLDLPGFGASAVPPETWGSADYADALAEWIGGLPPRPRIWIGYSFGGRIGIQLAARHPDLLDGMILIAAAGLPPEHAFLSGFILQARVAALRIRRLLDVSGGAYDRLPGAGGDRGIRPRGPDPMLTIMMRTFNENLAAVAPSVGCRTLLLYAGDDRVAPPDIGERLDRLIPHTEFHVLADLDHHAILTIGRHTVLGKIRRFLQLISTPAA